MDMVYVGVGQHYWRVHMSAGDVDQQMSWKVRLRDGSAPYQPRHIYRMQKYWSRGACDIESTENYDW